MGTVRPWDLCVDRVQISSLIVSLSEQIGYLATARPVSHQLTLSEQATESSKFKFISRSSCHWCRNPHFPTKSVRRGYALIDRCPLSIGGVGTYENDLPTPDDSSPSELGFAFVEVFTSLNAGNKMKNTAAGIETLAARLRL